VSLYECCMRKHPFDADNPGALILKILRGVYLPVSGYSQELMDVVHACLTQVGGWMMVGGAGVKTTGCRVGEVEAEGEAVG